MQSLAIKYRPKSFEELTEQQSIVRILTNQINTNTIKHAYLFTGSAGTGKTTSARIFANMINKGNGSPIEIDAASHNSVDDIRTLISDAETKPMYGEYKVYIADEVHMLSTSAWNAFLKTLEEPPAKSIFILCTTNPEKIPDTIMSRVQRFNFQKISTTGIVKRLAEIYDSEVLGYDYNEVHSALELIAKQADGGMRDAITLLDECMSYGESLTVDNVSKILNVVDYTTKKHLTDEILKGDRANIISIINGVYDNGMNLAHFITDYFEFILDLELYSYTGMSNLPENILTAVKEYSDKEWDTLDCILKMLKNLMYELKSAQNIKAVVLATFLLFEDEVTA